MSTNYKKVFNALDELLKSRGYKKVKANGQHYWLWFLKNKFPIYCWYGQYGSNKLFIDAELTELCDVLSKLKGVNSPSQGTTKNSKFEEFQFKNINLHTKKTEYEGFKFTFVNEHAAISFLEICEEYDLSDLESAKLKLSNYDLVDKKITSRKVKIDSRIGQQDFKKKLIGYWKKCAVTGCTISTLLRASHIKPWSLANELERLDHFNGLLLVPTLDALFDSGLITFNERGDIVISPLIPEHQLPLLGVSSEMRLRRINTAHVKYLSFHQQNVFKATL